MIKNPLTGLTAAVVFVLSGCASSDLEKLSGMPTKHESEICLAHNIANRYDMTPANTSTQQTIIDESAFLKDAPTRYVVKKGDTLWDISRRFLAKPWYWKKIWHANPQIKNPHWIYPGDVLEIVQLDGQPRIMMTQGGSGYHGVGTGQRTKEGLPVVKYSPHLRGESYVEPISIAGDILQSHMLKTEIVNPAVVSTLPFVYGTGIEYMTLSQEQEIFAKNLEGAKEGDKFNIYRPAAFLYDDLNVDADGKPIALGQELLYVGKVIIKQQDPAHDVTVLKLDEATSPIKEGYVLMPANNENPANYYPNIPNSQCSRGYFLKTTDSQKMMKEFDNVFVSFGRDNGAQVGDIWKVVRRGQNRVVNGQNILSPDKEIGFVMIYRVEDKFSYAFVLESSQNISYNDALVRPE